MLHKPPPLSAKFLALLGRKCAVASQTGTSLVLGPTGTSRPRRRLIKTSCRIAVAQVAPRAASIAVCALTGQPAKYAAARKTISNVGRRMNGGASPRCS
jgi:hypothetical protein